MILWLLPDAFDERQRQYLDTLRTNAINNKAFLKFDIENPAVSRWTTQNNSSDWEEIYRCWISDATKFKQTNIAQVSGSVTNSNLDSDIPILSLEDAARLITIPLFLNFENAYNDVQFIKCVVDKSTRKQVVEKIHNAEIVTKGGGIGEVKNELRRQTNSLILRFKMFVLTDSDCKSLDTPAADAIDVAEICAAKKVAFHTLRRRMIENYFPLELLYESTPTESLDNDINYKKVRAFYSLNTEQRYCMHLKKGLNRTDLHSNIYDDLQDETKQLLGDGFRGIGDWYSRENKQYVIHKLMHRNIECREVINLAAKIKNYIRTPA